MIANGRYPNALPARLLAAVEKARSTGLTVADLLAMIEPRKYEDARELLGRLVNTGRIHASGSWAHRRWFIDAGDALIWDAHRPRTDKEKRAAVRAALPEQLEAKRLKRLAQLKEPRTRYKWTDEQLATLRALYPTGGVRIAAEKTGQPTGAVRSMASCLGLKCTQRPPYKAREGTSLSRRDLRRQRKEAKAGKALVAPARSDARVVQVKKVRGPADQDGPASLHPDFKFTRCPSPSLALRTNTHSIL